VERGVPATARWLAALFTIVATPGEIAGRGLWEGRTPVWFWERYSFSRVFWPKKWRVWTEK